MADNITFEHYAGPPESAPAQLDGNGNPVRRGRGRPKGSKNKRKADVESHPAPVMPPSDTSDAPTPAQARKKQRRSASDHAAATNSESGIEVSPMEVDITGTSRSSGDRMNIAQTTLPPASPTIGSSKETPLPAPLVAAMSAAAANPRAVQGVVDRARLHTQHHSAAKSMQPPLPSLPAGPTLDLVDDVEDDNNSSTFISEGLGEEDEPDEEGQQPPKVEYPTWFNAFLEQIREELQHDLTDTLQKKI
uniref:Uncharacterized protein n=1 Tax=Mycena chlorophos TaxID=658473 RepID=A0ABQ0LWE2_MYCCL|nr:predicted protein [Mycena chlorophos]